MSWLALVIEVDAAEAESLSDALLELGALSVGVEDAAAGTPDEKPLFGEPGSPSDRLWERSIVRALCTPATDASKLMADAAQQAGLAAMPSYIVEDVPEQDWVRLTQAQFDPIRISERLWIVPSWHEPPDPDAIVLALDPGLAFGTGSHPTTRLCLRWLENNIHGGETVLDYGCGSGVLAIAACKLGAGTTIGVDIDPDAVVQARANAQRNDVVVAFIDSDGSLGFVADLVVANILATPLKLLAPLLAAHCRPGGRLVLAGVLEPQADDVAAAYEPWFDMSVWNVEEGWAALQGVRR